MKRIPLTRGMFALVDDRDYAKLRRYRWFARKVRRSWYAVCLDQERSMHQFIMGNRKGFVIDHRNCNGLDNRRRNLRWATYSQNRQNVAPFGRSGLKGVHWDGSRGLWRVAIKPAGKKDILIGRFRDPIEAARAYNAAAKHFFGEFAWLNDV